MSGTRPGMTVENHSSLILAFSITEANFLLSAATKAPNCSGLIFRGTMPYIWIVVAFMALMYAFPGMALWLPKYIYG